MKLTPSALDLQRLFLASDNVYPENEDIPVHDRWLTILAKMPKVRGKHLFDNMTEAFQEAYASSDRHVLSAGYDLAQLKHRFAIILHQAGLIPTHVLSYSKDEETLWLRRFFYKAFNTQDAMVKGNRIQKARSFPYDEVWIN